MTPRRDCTGGAIARGCAGSGERRLRARCADAAPARHAIDAQHANRRGTTRARGIAHARRRSPFRRCSSCAAPSLPSGSTRGSGARSSGASRTRSQVVEAVPKLGPARRAPFLVALGLGGDGARGVGDVGRHAGALRRSSQIALLVALNANGLLWARHIIHDPGGMVVKNVSFLLLAWVAAAMSGGAVVTAATAWQSGRFDARVGPKRILFGRMYEDVEIERAAFRRGRARLLHCVRGLHGARALRPSRGRRVRHQPGAARLRRAAHRRRADRSGHGGEGDGLRPRADAARGLEHRDAVRAFLALTSTRRRRSRSGASTSTRGAFARASTR